MRLQHSMESPSMFMSSSLDYNFKDLKIRFTLEEHFKYEIIVKLFSLSSSCQ